MLNYIVGTISKVTFVNIISKKDKNLCLDKILDKN